MCISAKSPGPDAAREYDMRACTQGQTAEIVAGNSGGIQQYGLDEYMNWRSISHMFGHQLYSAASILGENMLIQFNKLSTAKKSQTWQTETLAHYKTS